MWTRAEVKKRAWNGLKSYYWMAVLLGILLSLMGTLSVIPYALGGLLLTVCICLSPLAPFLGCIVNAVYANILGIGGINFYLKSIKEEKAAPISTMFSGFKTGQYKNSVKILMFRNIFQMLWSLLLVVPGIVKGYEYRMIPFLVADYPEKGQDEVFGLSKQMMTGNKWKVFVFDLSFIGWFLLAIIPAGLGLIFLLPYYNAACTELYLALKEEYLGVPRITDNHVVYQPENSAPIPQIYMGDDDDAVTVDINSYAFQQKQVHGQPMLVGVQGEYAGASIPIEAGQKLVVGRDSARCNVVLSSAQVSRLHMTVEYNGNKFVVTDYSTYGTYDLEQGRLPKERTVNVTPGSSLRLGNGEDIFRLEVR